MLHSFDLNDLKGGMMWIKSIEILNDSKPTTKLRGP